jgi:hypothetical protein
MDMYPKSATLNEEEFSAGLAKLEKRFLQFALPHNSYLPGNRPLAEFTLTLKETGNGSLATAEDALT